MPYSTKDRDRVEAWPPKPTKDKLKAKAKKAKKSFTEYVNDVLKEAAK